MSFAIFDLDLTLLPYDTQLLFCNHVLRRHGLRRAYLGLFVPACALYGARLLSTRRAKRAFLSYLWRLPKAELKDCVRAFVEEDVVPALYPEIVAELERHRSLNRTLILNTASPAFYAEAIGERLGFDHVIGTPVRIQERQALFPPIDGANNKYDFKLKNMRHLMPTDLSLPLPGAWAYSDSRADLPLLRFVENPVAVNPDPYLKTIATEEGWRVMTPARPVVSRLEVYRDCLLQATGFYSPNRAPAVEPLVEGP